MAYIHNHKKNYQKARETLLGLTSHTGPWSETDREILHWYLQINDYDPRSLANKVLLFSIALENQESFPRVSPKKPFDVDRVSSIYSSFLKVHERIKKEWVPLKYEIRVASSIRVEGGSAHAQARLNVLGSFEDRDVENLGSLTSGRNEAGDLRFSGDWLWDNVISQSQRDLERTYTDLAKTFWGLYPIVRSYQSPGVDDKIRDYLRTHGYGEVEDPYLPEISTFS